MDSMNSWGHFLRQNCPMSAVGLISARYEMNVSYGFAYPFSANIMKTLKPHGLKDGVKLEFVEENLN